MSVEIELLTLGSSQERYDASNMIFQYRSIEIKSSIIMYKDLVSTKQTVEILSSNLKVADMQET